MQWSHVLLTKQFWHATGECSVQKPLGILHTDVQITQQHPVAHYSYHERKLQGFQRTFLCGSQQALGHSCSSDAPGVNRGTCVIQLRMLQENAAVTAPLSCTHQLSPFGKENLHFLKAKYLQSFQSVPPEFSPLAYGLSWSYNTENWWSLQLSPSLAVKRWHPQLCMLLDVDWHQYFSWLTLKSNTHGSILRIWWKSMFDTKKHPGKVQMSPQN